LRCKMLSLSISKFNQIRLQKVLEEFKEIKKLHKILAVKMIQRNGKMT